MYGHRSRGGTRGGADQFKWEDVKTDSQRQNYLGHSVMAPVGRWQQGKDLHWYTKGDSTKEEVASDERRRIKREEQSMMMEYLGMKPRKSRRPEASQVGKHDMKEVLEKGQVELKSERIGGLGYTPVKQLDVVEQALVFHPERHCERSRSPRQRKTQPANISRSGDYSDRSEHRAERYSHEDMSYRRRRRMDPPSYDRQTSGAIGEATALTTGGVGVAVMSPIVLDGEIITIGEEGLAPSREY